VAIKPKCWRMSQGERGLRVAVFERRPKGRLYLEAFADGRRITRKSLGHTDKALALAKAKEVYRSLQRGEEALDWERPSLSTLFDMYRASEAHRDKARKTQRDDEGKLRRVIKFMGVDRDASTLAESDVRRYRRARISGQGPKGKVGARAVQADLVALQTMLNWAARQRRGREFLLNVNPLRGVKLPGENNPNRPIETYETFVQLMEQAPAVDWRLPAVLMLVEFSGQRIGSVLKLRRQDVDLECGWVNFPGRFQKTKFDHRVPLSPDIVEMLRGYVQSIGEEPDALLFPSDRDPTSPVSRWGMDAKLREAYRRAGLKPAPGGLWHPWRRKWATERKDMPLKDVAEAGGWKDLRTLLKYQQVDEQTLRDVVLNAPKLTKMGLVRRTA
jgi:integrase